jgi:L-aspartate semialdehyde sulfurtransferase ferredoxin
MGGSVIGAWMARLGLGHSGSYALQAGAACVSMGSRSAHPPLKRRLTLHFPRQAVHQPITYRLAVDFDIAAKILRAQVAPNQSGTMVVELSGDIDELDAAELWLESLGLSLDRAPGEIRIDPARCVDCGICSSVCPSGALSSAPPDWRLSFDAQRCLVCEQCIPSCPLEAIALVLEPR